MHRPGRLLRTAALLELGTMAVLLSNLATFHLQAVASAVGPLHGCAYLIVLIATVREPHADRTTVALSAVPGIGGLLARRRLAANRPPARPPVGRM
ncbi:DUF3817 domain-containing protein [Streptomyces virginiae]|uniref:DUF3817 domain-containing protein n=1 Tax=Streptomyces virginiae TaxID=1961 RepID=UPI00224D7D1B|nr:DUF3817 domain-containing protein [Streptomyces virginiae]MCX4957606.1 DUF3817 domain-containing protein [Streptomyces virginiae]